MRKVDMSPEAVSERLRIAGKLSEELLKSTFEQRYEEVMREQAELKAVRQKVRLSQDELSDDTCDPVSAGK